MPTIYVLSKSKKNIQIVPMIFSIFTKGLNPSKALGPDELHPRVLKELAMVLGPVFAHLFQQHLELPIPLAIRLFQSLGQCFEYWKICRTVPAAVNFDSFKVIVLENDRFRVNCQLFYSTNAANACSRYIYRFYFFISILRKLAMFTDLLKALQSYFSRIIFAFIRLSTQRAHTATNADLLHCLSYGIYNAKSCKYFFM